MYIRRIAFYPFCLIAALIPLPAQDTEKVAEINGSPILASEVDAKLGNNLSQLQQQIFELRQKQLESMIDQKLLEMESARRGMTIADLVDLEITAKVTRATDEESAKFYRENKEKLQGDYKTLQDQIKNFLTAQRLQGKQQEYLKSLRAAAKVRTLLQRPPVYRFDVSSDGAPFRGPANAAVTLIEFSDFHCPFCKRTKSVLDELHSQYSGKLKIVFRDFPLDSLHPTARAAAESARCAQEQNKFWQFRDELFRLDADSSPAAMSKIAKTVGMDTTAFDGCIRSGKYKDSVQISVQEGARLGITGTPTFFINGRILVGAQPLEAFAKIIDEELTAVSGPLSVTGKKTRE